MARIEASWQEITQREGEPKARSSHAIAVAGDKMFVFGGEFEPRVPIGNAVHVMDLSTREWSIAPASGDIPSPRIGITMVALGSTLYVFGGRDGDKNELSDFYSFDTVTGQWRLLTTGDKSPPGRSYHTMAADPHRCQIYIFGGCDPHTHTLKHHSPLPHDHPSLPRSYHTMGETNPQRAQIYIFSGCGTTFTLTPILSNTTPHSLTTIPFLPRSYHTMAAADPQIHIFADPHRAQIYIFGGCGTTGRFNDLWAYPVAPSHTNTWRQLPSPPPSSGCVPRGGPGLAVAGDAVWVLFGFSGEHELGDVHRFDLGKETWEEVGFPAAAGAETAGSGEATKGDEVEGSAVKPIPRSVFGAVTVSLPAVNESACKEYIVVYGGEVDPSDLGHLGAGKFSKDLFLLDVEERKWLRPASLVSSGGDPGARGWFPVAPLAAGMVVYGGNSESNDRLDDVFVLRLTVA
ncbi:unnamed protein product [Closterium sp. NIES-64]|nr:unnamed protein product [Closterium sp. NIES-64]